MNLSHRTCSSFPERHLKTKSKLKEKCDTRVGSRSTPPNCPGARWCAGCAARSANVTGDIRYPIQRHEPDERPEKGKGEDPLKGPLVVRLRGAHLARVADEVGRLHLCEVVDVCVARLGRREGVVLGQDGGEVPAVELADDTDDTSSTVLW